MQDSDGAADGPTLVTSRTIDILLALLFLVIAGIVMVDAWRLGFGWIEGHGPAAGYFPFRIAVIMAAASIINLFRALLRRTLDVPEVFVTRPAFLRVLAVLLPALGFVALIELIGIYVASAIFVAGFMLVLGRQNPLKSLAVGAGVPVTLFLLFEKWFLVPLPKGPLEAMLGY